MTTETMIPQRSQSIMKSEEYRPLASMIRQCRLAAGITQREISEFCDVTQSTFSRIEKGKRYPSVTVIYRIAEFLEIDIHQLLIITALSALDAPGISHRYLATIMGALKEDRHREVR